MCNAIAALPASPFETSSVNVAYRSADVRTLHVESVWDIDTLWTSSCNFSRVLQVSRLVLKNVGLADCKPQKLSGLDQAAQLDMACCENCNMSSDLKIRHVGQ